MIFRRQSSAAFSSGSADDGRLVFRAKTGDRRAFDLLVRQYQEALRGFVVLRVGSSAADDVLQEVWTACWLGISNFSGKSRFKSWLYGIAVNKCADLLRSSLRHGTDSLSEAEEIADDESLEKKVILRESIRTALAKLQEAQREVIELYYYAELTLPEIAEALKRNLNTVKYQFYRAHDQVACELGVERA